MKTTSLKMGSTCCAIFFLATNGYAQIDSIVTKASPFPTKESATRMVIPFPSTREADVMWAKRIWSFIDIRQKINQTLYYPHKPTNDRWALFDVIRYGLENDWITAYGLGPTQDDDEFRYPLNKAEVQVLLNPTVVRFRESLEDGTMEAFEQLEPVRAEDVVGYLIKEDWFFDKQRSSRQIRIIGLAPIVRVYAETGEIKGNRVLFWLYYPECRYLFAPIEVDFGHNTAAHVSFDQLFVMRRFSAQIVKEDNVYDRSIEDYAKGIDALLEAERIRQQLFELEHDLWSY
jgi:gliding motility associated protien GldN